MKTLLAALAALGSLVPTHCEPAPRSCPQYEALLDELSPGWDVGRMSAIMWRESRCNPDAWNVYGRAAGLLQVTPINYRYLSAVLGTPVDRWALYDPELNVRAAAALFTYWARSGSGYRPWST